MDAEIRVLQVIDHDLQDINAFRPKSSLTPAGSLLGTGTNDAKLHLLLCRSNTTRSLPTLEEEEHEAAGDQAGESNRVLVESRFSGARGSGQGLAGPTRLGNDPKLPESGEQQQNGGEESGGAAHRKSRDSSTMGQLRHLNVVSSAPLPAKTADAASEDDSGCDSPVLMAQQSLRFQQAQTPGSAGSRTPRRRPDKYYEPPMLKKHASYC